MAFLRKLNRLAAKQLQQAVVRERTSVAAATAATSAPLQAEQQSTSTSSSTSCNAVPSASVAAMATAATTANTRQIDPLDLKFNDPIASFKSKTMIELVRAYVVYQLCSVQFLVENNAKVGFSRLYKKL